MKNKVENGEVIEKILEKLWWRSNKAVYSGERTKEKDILSAKQAITNALNQQRENFRLEIDNIVNAHLWGDYSLDTQEVYEKMKEFLTKLEK